MSTKIIKLNRGDSYSFNIRIPQKDNVNQNYKLTADDVVYFAILYPNQRFEDAILLQGYDLTDQLTNLEIPINLKPSDTRCLFPGIYYYTVKLQRGGTLETINDYDEPKEVRTIIERTKLIIND